MHMRKIEFAITVGLSDKAIGHIEYGNLKITPDMAVNIAEHCGVGVEWLLYGKEDRKENPVDFWMEKWLWEHPEMREEIRRRMDNE